VPHEEALRIRDDVGFFQAVRAVLAKSTPGEQKTDEELDHAIRQTISKAVASDEVVDIFAAAGLKKPDISILSDEFLAEVRRMPHATWRSSCSASSWGARSKSDCGATSSRRAPSRTCWNRWCGDTRTG
jgi:hypothetical protein